MLRAQDTRVGEFTTQILSRGQTTLRAGVLRTVRVFQLHGIRHWYQREKDAFTQTLKTAGACAISWVLAKHLYQHGPNEAHAVLAPVATLITMQVTVYQTLRRGLQQVAAVLFGVIAALILGSYLGLTWYTLSALVVIALIIGRTLKLGTQVNQVATTALLVYSLGKGYGFERIWDTLIGAAVGMVANALIARRPSPAPLPRNWPTWPTTSRRWRGTSRRAWRAPGTPPTPGAGWSGRATWAALRTRRKTSRTRPRKPSATTRGARRTSPRCTGWTRPRSA